MLLHDPLPKPHTPKVVSPSEIPAVQVNHPGYDGKYQPLLYLHAFDSDDTTPAGVDFNVVYYGCCIIANNAWITTQENAPYFTNKEESTSASIVPPPPNGILPAGEYWFHVPPFTNANPYPILTTFTNWVFPHNHLPPPWRDLSIPSIPDDLAIQVLTHNNSRDRTISRDISCRLTDQVCGTENSHLVPTAEDSYNWFTINNMERYHTFTYSPAISDLSNTILLRSDVHYVMDQRIMTIVPKKEQDRYILVFQVINATPRAVNEELHLFHNRKLRPLVGISPALLFARFAWTLFYPDIIRLFKTKKARILVSVRDTFLKTQVPEFKQQYQTTLSRSQSRSNKRSTSDANIGGDDGGHVRQKAKFWNPSCGRFTGSSDEDSESDDSDSSEEFRRGRSLRRPNSPFSPALAPSTTSLISTISSVGGTSREDKKEATNETEREATNEVVMLPAVITDDGLELLK